MSKSPYVIFYDWLFDGKLDTPIPTTSGVDLLKYNSPINQTFLLGLFMKNIKLNHYLNKRFNNFNLRSLTREDMFLFIKKCVMDFRIKRRDIIYYKRTYEEKIYTVLRDKLAYLKNDDINLLIELINKSKDKNIILESLGITLPKKKKLNVKKKEKKKIESISLKTFLDKNFKRV